MKKILCLAFILLIAMSAICAASPMPEYSIGKVTLDLNTGAPDLSSGGTKVDGKNGLGYGVTAGIGFGFAGQYNYNDFKAKSAINGSTEIKAQQLVLVDNLVDLIANVSIFGGVSKTGAVGSSEKDGAIVGIAASVPLISGIKAYGTMSVGNRVSGYELGLGYNISENAALNLGYRDTKYKDITFGDGTKDDVTAKGLVGGVSFTL